MDSVRFGAAPPLSAEWFQQQKKLLKESGMEKTSAASMADDIYTPSAAAAESLQDAQAHETPEEKFLESARTEIMKLDPGSEAFVPEATSALVEKALGQVFGDKVARSPGFPQMHDKITNTILGDEKCREVIEDFLEILVQSEYSRLDNGDNLA